MSKMCEICGGLQKIKVSLNIPKEDAIGFVFFCIALAAPVGFLAFIWRMIEDSLPFGSSFILLALSCYRNKKVYLYLYITVLGIAEAFSFTWFYIIEGTSSGYTALSPVVAFILAFYSIGYGIYRFFSLFVNYHFLIKSKCLSCNKEITLVELPNKED